MSEHLCITVRWLGDRFHGFTDDRSGPEWPPSPFRLLQALVAGAHQYGAYEKSKPALQWVERQAPPKILAEHQPNRANKFDHFVPDNDNRLDHNKPVVRVIEPCLLGERPTVTYVWDIDPVDTPPVKAIDDLCSTLSSFGCSVDQAFASARLARIAEISRDTAEPLMQFPHSPTVRSSSQHGTLRVPIRGSLDDLDRVFNLNRRNALIHTERRKKRWPSAFQRVVYTGLATPPVRPHAVFKLVDDNDDTVAHPQSKLIHIAGMVKHAAIELMRKHPPADVRGRSSDEWLRAYVSGHQSRADKEAGVEHAQFSYVPLQTVNPHNDLADPSVRRVMIVAPLGDDAWLEHLARRLDGAILKPLPNTTLPPGARLERIADRRHDGVREAYTRPSRTWASTTPVILPGHDDHKPEKARKLILKALQQSGIDQPCTFEWSAFSPFRKMLGAHKYVKDAGAPDGKRRINYIRPDHLLDLTGVHLTLTFEHDVPGPLTLGAGRHCGFGLMAAVR